MREKSRRRGFFRGSGFYIAVCCCVLAIGVMGYLTNRSDYRDNGDIASETTAEPVYTPSGTLAPLYTPDAVAVDRETIVLEPEPTKAPEPTEAPEEESEPDEPASADVVVDESLIYSEPVAGETVEQFILPNDGEILCHYTDALVYNEYLGDWRAHNGVDLRAEEGSDVMVAAAGVVESITQDYLGTTITVDHKNGYKTRYSNVVPREGLKAGDEIAESEPLATVASDAKENTTDPHIHFEMISDGKYVNPLDYTS